MIFLRRKSADVTYQQFVSDAEFVTQLFPRSRVKFIDRRIDGVFNNRDFTFIVRSFAESINCREIRRREFYPGISAVQYLADTVSHIRLYTLAVARIRRPCGKHFGPSGLRDFKVHQSHRGRCNSHNVPVPAVAHDRSQTFTEFLQVFGF